MEEKLQELEASSDYAEITRLVTEGRIDALGCLRLGFRRGYEARWEVEMAKFQEAIGSILVGAT